ncbi:MAG: ABC transporter permease [Planctomycetota bacterium]
MAIPVPPLWARLPFIGNLGWPIALKEVRSLMRRNRYFWVQFTYLIVLGVGVVGIIWSKHSAGLSPEIIGRNLSNGFFFLQNFLVLLIFPAFAATAISGERVEKSYDLLITTDLKPSELIWGKFLGIFGNSCYFLLVTLPLLATCILFGGVMPLQVLENYAVLLVEAALITAYGLYISSASQSNLRSIMGTYALVLVLGGLLFSSIGSTMLQESTQLSLSVMLAKANSWPGEGRAIAAVLAYGVLVAFCLCFLGAVLRLTSREANRGTPMRVFVLLGLGAAMLLINHVAQLRASCGLTWAPRDQYQAFVTVLILFLLVLPIPLLGFSGGRVATPLRAARFAERRPWLARCSWLLLPGGIRGLLFSGFLILGCMAFLSFAGKAIFHLESYKIPGFRENAWVVLKEAWTLIALGFVTYCALSFLLSTLGVQGYLNYLIVVGCAILATLYAVVHVADDEPPSPMVLEETAPRWWHLYPFSILVTLMKYMDVDYDNRWLLLQQSIWAHLFATLLLTVAGMVFLVRDGLPIWGVHRLGLESPR